MTGAAPGGSPPHVGAGGPDERADDLSDVGQHCGLDRSKVAQCTSDLETREHLAQGPERAASNYTAENYWVLIKDRGVSSELAGSWR